MASMSTRPLSMCIPTPPTPLSGTAHTVRPPKVARQAIALPRYGRRVYCGGQALPRPRRHRDDYITPRLPTTTRLDSVELYPFRIHQCRPFGMMIGHLDVPALNTKVLPASLAGDRTNCCATRWDLKGSPSPTMAMKGALISPMPA